MVAGIADRIKWFTLLRVLVVTAVLVGAIVLDLVVESPPLSNNAGVIVYRYALAMYVLSLLGLAVARWVKQPLVLNLTAFTSVVVDMGLATVLVLVSEGTASPLVFCFPLATLAAAMALERRGAIFAATVASLAITFVGGVEARAFPSIPSLAHLAHSFVAALGHQPTPHTNDIATRMATIIAACYATGYLTSRLAMDLRAATERATIRRREFESLRVHYDDVVSSMPSGLLTTTLEHTIVTANPMAFELLGLDASSLLGRDVRDLFPGLRPALSGDESSPVTRGGSPTEIEWTCPDGKRRVLECSLSPLRTGEGTRSGRVIMLVDVTLIRAMESRLRDQERLAAIGKMAATVAHEIRNPLASISGSIELLESTFEPSSDDRKLMRIVLRETDHLSAWIGELLDFTRPQLPAVRLTDLVRIARETLEAFSLDARVADGGTEVLLSVGPDTIADADVDPGMMRQVLWNLLINAAQAVGEVTEPSIRLEIRRDGDTAHLDVVDNGPGIAPEDLPHLFEPFYTTRRQGTGLGLAMVRRIVEDHHGKVSVRNESPTGARFSVTIPCRALGSATAEAPATEEVESIEPSPEPGG